MSADNQQGSTVSQMSDLFGDPPLMKGEDTARYWRLHAQSRMNSNLKRISKSFVFANTPTYYGSSSATNKAQHRL